MIRNNPEQRRAGHSSPSCNNMGATSISSDRRSFISGIAAAGFSALACSSAGHLTSAFAQTPVVAKTSLIDVHHHFVPPFYLAENRDRIAAAGGGRINPAYYLNWTPERALAAMDKHGASTAVLSLSASAFWFGDREAAARTARRANEMRRRPCAKSQRSLRPVAIIPLPDTEGYYDIAGTAYRPAIAALTSLVPTTQILFGSDNPFVPLAETAEGMTQVGFSAADLQLIGRDNALALLPGLKKS